MQDGPPGGVAPPVRFPWAKVTTLFLVTGMLVYLPALLSYFSSDDFLHLGRVVEGGLPFVPDGSTGGFLRPVVGASFWLEYHLWGLQPFGFHFSNILVHNANSLMAVALARRLQHPADRHRCFFPIATGLIFLVMACHAEPVSWISGRTDVFATFFMMAGLISATLGMELSQVRYYAMSLNAFAMALFTKESALAYPFVLALTTFLWHWRTNRSWSMNTRCWFFANLMLLGAYVLCRRAILGVFVGGYGAQGHLRLSRDILAQATGRFAWRTFFPPMPEGVATWMAQQATLYGYVWLGTLFCIFVWLVYRTWRRRTAAISLFFFCAFGAALLPVINVRIQWTNSEGERFLYFASIFAAMAVAYAISRLSGYRWRGAILATILAVQIASLLAGTLNWHFAGNIAHSVVSGLQARHNGGRVILVNKPDSCDGALVFRTGLPEGLRYFGNRPIADLDIDVLYATTILQSDHGFSLEQLPDAATETYRISATGPTSELAEEDRGNLIDTIEASRHARTFRFREPLRDVQLFYYDHLRIAALSR